MREETEQVRLDNAEFKEQIKALEKDRQVSTGSELVGALFGMMLTFPTKCLLIMWLWNGLMPTDFPRMTIPHAVATTILLNLFSPGQGAKALATKTVDYFRK